MNRRLLIILLSAFAVAALSTYLVVRVVGSRIASVKPQAITNLVAAAADTKIGTILTAKDLKTVQVVGAAPEGAILKPENAIGRGVISALYAGEPILDSRLAPLGSGGGLAATIHEGMRACAVKVDDVVGVAGFATPGMRVDVLISGVPPGANNQEEEVKTVLQNIEVLSAGTDIQKDAEGKPKRVQVVNLLVTPEQAQYLALASGQARIQLVLRNPLDTKITPVPIIAMANVFEGPRTISTKKGGTLLRRAKPAPKPFTIQVINGSKQTEAKFASPGGQQ